MVQEVYRELLDVMKKRGGAYSGMDIPEFYALVEELFTPEEAAVNNAMPRGPFQAADLAKIMGQNEEELRETLEGMANGGLCIGLNLDGAQLYQSARFMPGILEFVFMGGNATERDKRIAVLIHDYEIAYKANSDDVAPGISPYRVITVDRTVQTGNRVHTYDQVHAMIEQQTEISVSTCYCRHAAFLRDEDTHGMPMEVCMQFGIGAQFAAQRLGARKVTKEQALEILNQAEDAGLIHMSQNFTEGADYLCNCDRWHCNAVKTALSKPKPALFFNSGFEPHFDADLCVACETCIDRCPPEALVMGDDDLPQVDLDRCFGCAVCATGCPSEAVTMTNIPEYQAPPKNRNALKGVLKASRGYA